MAWEIASLKVPFGETISTVEYLCRVVEGGERPDMDRGWDEDFKKLLGECWTESLSARPNMVDVVGRLEEIVNRIE